MTRRRIAVPALSLGLLLTLSACGNSNLNPFNWFQSNTNKAVAVIPDGGFLEDQETRQLVAQVTDLQVLRAPGGAIVRASGLPPRLGYWNAELVAENGGRPENGVLTYSFRITEPRINTNQGRPQQREVFVGRFVSDIRLSGVTQIRVLGMSNSRTARR